MNIFMIEKVTLKQLSVGIRHRRTFRIPEIAGEIIDSILHDGSSPFKDYIRTDSLIDVRGENKGRMLIDETGENSVTIDIDNVVVNFLTDDLEKGLKEFNDVIIPYISKNIHKAFKIENFNRIGIVYNYKLVGSPNNLLGKLTNDEFTTAENGLFRFGAKEIDTRSLVMKDLLDYKNYLIAIGFDENDFIAKFDYQFYFNPEIKSIADIDFSGFLNESKEKLESKFLKWMTNEESK